MAAFSTAALLVCLLLGPVASLAAIATIDVGAAAVGNEWRPASCDAVKDGVVLTNMVANVKAIIDGCTIALTSESNAANSAVKVASFGAGSSIELRNCDISATFTVNAQSAAIRFGTLAAGNSILLSNTTVTGSGEDMVGMYLSPGTAGSSASVTVSEGSAFSIDGGEKGFAIQTADGTATFGDDSAFTVVDSSVAVNGVGVELISIRASFGDRGRLTLSRSNFTSVGAVVSAVALYLQAALGDHCSFLLSHCTLDLTTTWTVYALFFTAPLGDNCSVSVVASNISAAAVSQPEGLRIHSSTIGDQFSLRVVRSSIAGHGTPSSDRATALSLSQSQMGTNASLVVTDSTLNSTSGENGWTMALQNLKFAGRPTLVILRSNIVSKAIKNYGQCFSFIALSLTWWKHNEGFALTIDSSRMHASAAVGSANAVLLFATIFVSLSVDVVSSMLQVLARYPASPASGAIAFTASQWNGGSLTVSKSELTLLDGTPAASGALFVEWPNTISGLVSQVFDTVTLSAPAGVLAAPFAANAGGTYSVTTTFCANNVKWANGTAVVAGPPEFTAVTTCQDTVTSTASLSATVSPHVSKSLSLSPPASPTLTAPRTASAAPSKTASTSTTHSSVPTTSRPVTASNQSTASKLLTLSPQLSMSVSKSSKPTATVLPTKTLLRTATPLTPAPATPAPETPAPATPTPVHAATSSSGSAATPAPVTPAPATPAPATPAPATPAPWARSSQATSSASSTATPAPGTPAPLTPRPPVQSSAQSSASSGSTAPAPAITPAPITRSTSSAATPASVTSQPTVRSSASADSSASATAATPAPAMTPAPAQRSSPLASSPSSSRASSFAAPGTPAPGTPAPSGPSAPDPTAPPASQVLAVVSSTSSSEDSGSGIPATPAPPSRPWPSAAAGVSVAVLLAVAALVFAPV